MGVAAGAPCCNVQKKEVVIKCSGRKQVDDPADGAHNGVTKEASMDQQWAGAGAGLEPILSGRDSAGGTSGVAAPSPVLPPGPSQAAQAAATSAPSGAASAPYLMPSAASSSALSAEGPPQGAAASGAATSVSRKQFAFRGRQESLYEVESYKDPRMFASEPALQKNNIAFDLQDGEGHGRKVDRKSTGFMRVTDLPPTAEDDEDA
mmetsp:Transcript_47438/g.140105  ORF Transcript_47438/g.140105 Transcript_47438/m.140105 type:complete len:206 (-) Transcript_47438:132-749(-)